MTGKNLLGNYRVTFEEAAACRPGKPPLVATLTLPNDIHEVFPYLIRVVGSIGFVAKPPAMIIKKDGRQIALEPKKITISDIQKSDDAAEIINWLDKVINDIWRRHSTIEPSFNCQKTLRVVDIVALLPKSNCGACGEPSCMAFAVKLSKGKISRLECTPITPAEQQKLAQYLQH